MSSKGRPESELHRSAQREGGPLSSKGRPESELHRSAQREGSPLTSKGVRIALRTLTWTQIKWAMCLGAVGGLLFLLTNSTRTIGSILLGRSSPAAALEESAVAIVVCTCVALFFLVAITVAQHGDRGQPHAWRRYAIATLLATGAATTLVEIVAQFVPIAALVGWYNIGAFRPIAYFTFTNFLLLGGLGVLVYVHLMRARRSQAAFDGAEIVRAATRRKVLRARLAAMQAQVEPRFLFDTLAQVEALYDHDAGAADRLLDDLIAYLRAALPVLRGEGSTLARECELAGAYLRIAQARMGSRLSFLVDVPTEVAGKRFPPMLLLPLIDNALRHGLEPLTDGGRVEVRAEAHAARLRLTVADDGFGDATTLREGSGLAALRERLAALYGGDAVIEVRVTDPRGVTATIEVPMA